jgi:hypothetical protein
MLHIEEVTGKGWNRPANLTVYLTDSGVAPSHDTGGVSANECARIAITVATASAVSVANFSAAALKFPLR